MRVRHPLDQTRETKVLQLFKTSNGILMGVVMNGDNYGILSRVKQVINHNGDATVVLEKPYSFVKNGDMVSFDPDVFVAEEVVDAIASM